MNAQLALASLNEDQRIIADHLIQAIIRHSSHESPNSRQSEKQVKARARLAGFLMGAFAGSGYLIIINPSEAAILADDIVKLKTPTPAKPMIPKWRVKKLGTSDERVIEHHDAYLAAFEYAHDVLGHHLARFVHIHKNGDETYRAMIQSASGPLDLCLTMKVTPA